jgi:hypothetical protein
VTIAPADRALGVETPVLAVQQIADGLSQLRGGAMDRLVGRSKAGSGPVRTYLTLLAEAHGCSVSDGGEAAAVFQRRFNGFYGVRRNLAWRQVFYDQFQMAKARDEACEALFNTTLEAVHQATQRIEASFVSKLVATLIPTSPVIDSVVRGFLVRRLASAPEAKGLEGARAFYVWLNQVMLALIETAPARDWFAEFDTRFAGEPGAAGITDMKKLDFLIWGGAER